MTQTNRYGALASWVYHLDKPIGRSFGDVEYYRDRLAGCSGPILEPAVGNGRALIPLLEAGHTVHGFDTSADMLVHCRAECERRGLTPRLGQQSFETFTSDTVFDAIVVPAGSIQLITDADAALAVLARFRAALKAGGRLLLDLDPLSALAEPPFQPRQWHDGDDTLTLREEPVERDFVRQISVSKLHYEHWRDGRLVTAETELFSLRLWGTLEMELALRNAGFTQVTVSSDYRHGQAPHRESEILTVEAIAG